MLPSATILRAAVLGMLGTLSALWMAPAAAAKMDISKNPPLVVGPSTSYGETAQEAANKRVMFEFVHLVMGERKPQTAFENYMSKSYCNCTLPRANHANQRGV